MTAAGLQENEGVVGRIVRFEGRFRVSDNGNHCRSSPHDSRPFAKTETDNKIFAYYYFIS
ncbi:hypothetical protein ACFL2Q_02705 [Thermodesulfobacteriota bacterium]